MNTKELDEDLDYLRDRIIQLANGCKHSEQMKDSLSVIADRLEAAQKNQVPGDIKAAVLSLGKLVVRAATLPEWTIDENDSGLLTLPIERRILLQ